MRFTWVNNQKGKNFPYSKPPSGNSLRGHCAFCFLMQHLPCPAGKLLWSKKVLISSIGWEILFDIFSFVEYFCEFGKDWPEATSCNAPSGWAADHLFYLKNAWHVSATCATHLCNKHFFLAKKLCMGWREVVCAENGRPIIVGPCLAASTNSLLTHLAVFACLLSPGMVSAKISPREDTHIFFPLFASWCWLQRRLIQRCRHYPGQGEEESAVCDGPSGCRPEVAATFECKKNIINISCHCSLLSLWCSGLRAGHCFFCCSHWPLGQVFMAGRQLRPGLLPLWGVGWRLLLRR